ncbi:MAG TPA: DUF362 domain-containing protein [Phycisphaerae bacterium]|nr:DUF362 domain-containing protein [Phycisphaerae bacterium]
MNRREFLKTLVGGACAATLSAWRARWVVAAEAGKAVAKVATPPAAGATVAIHKFAREQDAAKAVDAALELIGGIDKIVRSGDVVVIKPNLVNATAGRWVGRVTGSRVMEGVIRAVADCGGKPVVAEGTCEHAYGTTVGFARETGLLAVCRRYGAKFVDLNNDEVVRGKVPRPLLWSELHLARQVTECDRFISVPVMKVHRAAGVTLGMKNLVGITSAKFYGGGRQYVRARIHEMERRMWRQRYGSDMHGESEVVAWTPLGATIADLASVRPIDLVVVDGTFGEERDSPSGDFVDIKERSGSYLVLAGADTVAVDSVGAHVMRQMPHRLQQIRFAAAKGLGVSSIDQIRVVGERLEDVAVPLRGYLLG